MAIESVEITAGSGTKVAVDTVDTDKQVQYTKLMDGTDGSAAVIPGDATYGLDVDVTRLPALVAGSANIGDVDVASIAAGDNNIGNVDVVTLPALPTGSNAIGKLAANSGVDIGDVDVASVPAPLNVAGNGTAATALRVTVASDSTGQVKLAAGTAEIGKLAAGTAGIGKLTANSGVDIGDVDVASIAAGTNLIGKVGIDQTTPGTTNKVVASGAAFSVVATLTVTNGAYTIADVVGGLITWANVASANGGSVTIDTITLNGVVAIPYELWFYNADIATPRADNAVFGLAAADGLKALGHVPISTADYCTAQTTFVEGTVRGVGLTVSTGAATTSLYAYLKATAVTSPGTTTLYLRISGVRND